MAKSLRAKSHLKAKSIKRKGVFQNVVDARTDRLAEKLKQGLIDQKMQKLKAKDGDMELDEGVLQLSLIHILVMHKSFQWTSSTYI